MTSSQSDNPNAKQACSAAAAELKLEVVIIPVADVDRAKRFYSGLGFRLDADFATGESWRVVQLTPPGSPCSIIFGKGITTAIPGSVQGTFLIVSDIEVARAALIELGASVSEVFHFDGGLHVSGTNGRVPGHDPDGNSYRSWASFSDPDGNSWMIQEIKARLPGRGLSLDAGTLTELLREAEERHGTYEPTAPTHHWSEWYATYIIAREQGKTPEQAVRDGALHVAGIRS